jgi:tetratricopeptide (TPR) repeat protein
MQASRVRLTVVSIVAAWAVAGVLPANGAGEMPAKVPITTASAEARRAYLKGRDLLEKLRATDARAHFAKAAELDPGFALAYYGLANTALTAGDFFAALHKAVPLADKVSEGEAHMIRALAAGVNGQPDVARQNLTALVKAYPDDERAHTLLGGYYFGRQDWQAAIDEYHKAVAINPEFSQPYNQLGYALRFMGRYDEAEQAFKKYVQLIPGEPNPYDSYAELLMKRGRFTDSIVQYRKALAHNPNFVASYIGIANDQIFLGKPKDARVTLAKLQAIARNDGERRQAHFWIAVSYLHEGDSKAALGELEKNYGIAKKSNDRVAMGGDLNQMGTILLEAGEADAALAKYDESVAMIDSSDATAQVKEAAHRNQLANLARVELVRKDLAAADAAAKEYRKQVEVKKVPFQVWQAHEIAGLVAAAKGDPKTAVAELEQANQQDPRVLFALGEAYAAAGNAAAAKKALARAANFNGFGFDGGGLNYALVRAKAQAKLKS